MSEKKNSAIGGFYQKGIGDRLQAMVDANLLSQSDLGELIEGAYALHAEQADKLIENVISVFGLPFSIGLNMQVNGRDYALPMVVEEPSIVAAISAAAKIARASGGYSTQLKESLLIGQVQLVGVRDVARAKTEIIQHKEELLALANSLHPNMVARGGGAVDIEVHTHRRTRGDGAMLVVHFLVDTCDAMGANLVNTMCEGVASRLEELVEGRAFLRILSNLADRSVATAQVRIPVDALAGKGFSGEAVRDGIILAAEFAEVDPYRATTHNKGILNGIDPIAIATGNDWRAIEAGAHAYASRDGRYTSLTRWWASDDDGALCGRIDIPLKVGIVGGQMTSNPMVPFALKLLGVQSASELAQVMAAAGLAQNFSAIKALSTEGIQRGHMSLHARSCVASVGASEAVFDEAVKQLVQSGIIKVWKAREIVADLESAQEASIRDEGWGEWHRGHGKAILFGEHAVVYGARALAIPVPAGIEARTKSGDGGIRLCIPDWGVDVRWTEAMADAEHAHAMHQNLKAITEQLGVNGMDIDIEVRTHVQRAMGLGGSAALAVAVVRALAAHAGLFMNEHEINRIAFECEKLAHGTPSGIDNTLATYGEALMFRRHDDGTQLDPVHAAAPLYLVVGISGVESLTAKMVSKVATARQQEPDVYDAMFAQIDRLAVSGLEAWQNHDLQRLGALMNINHGLLNGMGVTCPQIEEMVWLARDAGAVGAKLTGGGGGGSMIALCADEQSQAAVVQRLNERGFTCFDIIYPSTKK